MQKFLTTFVLVLISTVALALPAPKDIEAAVKAGQLSQAEAMLHEVIKEKPGSAKAHYELGQVLARQGRNGEARQELLEAQKIDPSLKFASDPQHFRDVLKRSSAQPASPPLHPAKVAAPAPAEPAMPWGYVLLGGGVLVVIWLLARRATSAGAMPMARTAGGGAMGASGYGPGPGYGPGYGAPPAAPGSGMGGAVLGGLAGMAAGYGLAKALESRDGEHRPDGGHAASDDSSGFIPLDSPGDDGFFDAGAGDSWDGGDSSSGDDNW